MVDLNALDADPMGKTGVGAALLDRYYEKRVRGHKKLTDWARQMLYQAHKWLPGRQ